MALLNTALVLAGMSRRVLIVDFDLEAPSLPTYDTLTCSAETPGILDFVDEYLSSGSAPDAAKYIAECSVENAKLWVMPAGRAADGYGTRLQSIDWSDLYENHSGFLLLEDLKQQWRSLGYDYVLIDSRTGHTDVGGICTRQLPELVIVMFVPNEQNISGLEQIVDEIRRESSSGNSHEIGIIFCPSNVPDLDDEKDILRDRLAAASSRLGFASPAAIIHHYPSLDVLSQKPFVTYRPNTKLSREYKELARAILASNLSDRDGALIGLSNILRDLRNPDFRPSTGHFSEFFRAVSTVQMHHGDDAEVAYQLSLVQAMLGDIEGELGSLNIAIQGGARLENALRRRAAIYLQMGRRDEGIGDLERILYEPFPDSRNFFPAVEMLRSVDPKWMTKVSASERIDDLDATTKTMLIDLFQSSRKGHAEAMRLAINLIDDASSSVEHREIARTSLALSLIGTGRFEEALEHIGVTLKDIIRSDAGVSDTFNFAMADWGLSGEPSVELFELISRRSDATGLDDANFEQCLALASFVAGRSDEAFKHLAAARQIAGFSPRSFSCWSYLQVPLETFLAELSAMEEQALQGRMVPPVVRLKRSVPGSEQRLSRPPHKIS